MSTNKNKKILTWMQMCCVRTCWLADAFPADTDECKQKRKRYLPDGGHGCVVFVCVGMIYLCGCVRTCWLADALPADADECKQKRKKIYLPDGGRGWRADGPVKKNKTKRRKEKIPDPRCGW